MNILVVDVGGTHVKLFATGRPEPVKLDSGPGLTAERMAGAVRVATAGWEFDVVSIGYPGPVRNGHPVWYLVPDGVVQYIDKRRLYRQEAS